MPDVDPTTPGVIADVENLLPTVRGYAPDYALSPSLRFPVTLPSRVFSADGTFYNGAAICLFGTADDLYAAQDSTLTVRSRAAPYTTINAGLEWRFATFLTASGTYVLATNARNTLQVTSNITTTDFADVSGAPKGNTICVQRNFVLLANFLSGSWPYDDGWRCSAQEDHTDWTPDIATQSAQGRLTATPGNIVRLVAFQDSVIAFKFNSCYRGFYSGPTGNTWSFPLLSKSIGLVSHDAVCEADNVLYWMGPAGFYVYAGDRPQPIPGAPWNFTKKLLRGLNTVQCIWDPVRRLVRWHIGSSNLSDGRSYGIAYHPDTGKWGRFYNNANCVFSIPIDRAPTFDGYNEFAAEPIVWTTFNVPGYIDADTNELMTGVSPPVGSSFTTGDIGDDDSVTAMMRGRVRFLSAPTSSAMWHSYRMDLGDPLTDGDAVTRNNGKYDVSYAARWHRMRFEQTGMYEVSGFSVGPQMAGKR